MKDLRGRWFRLLIVATLVGIPAVVTVRGTDQRTRPGQQRQRPSRETQQAGNFTREQAEQVAARLYRAVLGREGEAAGLSNATAEIQSGNLEGQIDTMVESPEFRRRIAGRNNAAQLLEQFFQALLGRKPDSSGVTAFLPQMRDGQYTSVLLSIVNSQEFRQVLNAAPNAGSNRSSGRSATVPTRLEAALDCQARVIDRIRGDAPGRPFLSFDHLPEVSRGGGSVQGEAVDRFDRDRQVSYSCQGSNVSYSYRDGRPARGGDRKMQFPSVAVKNCMYSFRSDLTFDAAALSATDTATEYVLGVMAGGRPSRYTCEMDRQRVVSANSR